MDDSSSQFGFALVAHKAEEAEPKRKLSARRKPGTYARPHRVLQG